MRLVLLSILLCFGLRLTAQVSNSVLPLEYIGNWYNPKNNEWNYGFFEKFAIINGKPVFYKEVRNTKKGFRVSFADSSSVQALNLEFSNNQLRIGKKNYNKVDKFLPDYQDADTTSFYDSKFQKIDTVYISGYLRGNSSNAPFEINITNWLTGEYEKFMTDVDEYGLFTIKIPLLNTSQSYIDWFRTHLLTVLTPGEYYFLYKDLQTGETVFNGDNAHFHNEIVKYNDFTYSNNISPKTEEEWRKKYDYEKALKDTLFLKLKIGQLDSLQSIDNQFISSHNLSARSLYYISNHNKFQIASSLMQKRFDLDRNKQELFSDKYMEVVKQKFYDKNLNPLSLSRENHTFLVDYIDYKRTENKKIDIIYHADIIKELINTGKIICDDKVKEYANVAPYLGREERDSLTLKKAMPILTDSLLRIEYNKIVDDNSKLIEDHVMYRLNIRNKVDFLKTNLSRELSDIFLTKNVLSRLNLSSQPLIDDLLEQSLAPIYSDFFKSLILKKNTELVEITLGKLKYPDHLKKTDHLKEAKDADAILAEILTPHKGKVVYLDFWGTWCVPCVDEMKYAGATKKAMEEKDVVFIYMANGTSPQAWEIFIKANSLEGENVFHYNLPREQQFMIERRLGVMGFPTYMLFDKEGKLVNNQAPRPSQLEALQKEVDKLL